MVKRAFYDQTKGRRAGDEGVEWRFSPLKTVVTIATTLVGAAIIGWGAYVTKGAVAGFEALKTVDLQVVILHQRITDGDEKLDAKFDGKYDRMIDIALDLKKEKTNGKENQEKRSHQKDGR